MMNALKKSTYLILTMMVVCFTACSKDDSASDDGGTAGNVGRAGDPHSYNIKITEGEDAGFEMSGKVPNEDGLALYFFDPEGEYQKSVVVSIYNDDMGFTGTFYVANNGNIVVPENEVWTVTSHEINKSFMAKDVSVTVSNTKYEGLPTNGYASFKLTFDGTYHQNINEDDIYKISGTVVVNLPGF